MMTPPLKLFQEGLKIQMSIFVLFRVLTKLFLPIISQKLSKTPIFIKPDFVSLQDFRGPSPTV